MASETWGVKDFDPITGLPSVPEGYFWRVQAPVRDSDYYMVQLCLTGSTSDFWHRVTRTVKVVGAHPINRRKISPEKILDAACYALTHDNEILNHFGTLEPIRTDLVGDYPPKSIKSAGAL